MERPKVNHEPTQRPLTGEVMYYNDMRRLNQMPGLYKDISDTAMQMYETEAAMYQDAGTRPDIMADYERFDDTAGEVVDSCIALTDELLAFRPEDDRFSFEDIAVELPADKVQDMLRELRAGALLADDDEQLAIESDGAYYRVLDAKKNQATPTGVGLRVWGWDDPKVVYTNKDDEPFDRFKHV
ncbi:MAG: hypothetical protein ABIR91_00795, partial [Candidatus Saccharimonadales bacterium]